MKTYTVAFSMQRMKVGCVLIQAALRGSIVAHPTWPEFTEFWFTDLPDDCAVYEINAEQVDVLLTKLKQHHDEEKRVR